MDYTPIIAWSSLAFISGAGAGIWLTVKLTAMNPVRLRKPQTLAEFSRRDIYVTPPITPDTTVRNIIDYRDETAKQLTFLLHDASGIDRDVTFSFAIVQQFLGCDTPTRYEYRGNHNDYKLLIGIAVYYHWVYRVGKGYQWSSSFGSRERRLKQLSIMRLR